LKHISTVMIIVKEVRIKLSNCNKYWCPRSSHYCCRFKQTCTENWQSLTLQSITDVITPNSELRTLYLSNMDLNLNLNFLFKVQSNMDKSIHHRSHKKQTIKKQQQLH
jgi:hypothetical protein